jgi:hypothetical protein
MAINPQAFGQQTIAAQWALSKRNGARGGRKSARKRRAKASASTPRKRRASSKRPARLVKGSAAAKRYMASIRRKRKR